MQNYSRTMPFRAAYKKLAHARSRSLYNSSLVVSASPERLTKDILRVFALVKVSFPIASAAVCRIHFHASSFMRRESHRKRLCGTHFFFTLSLGYVHTAYNTPLILFPYFFDLVTLCTVSCLWGIKRRIQ